jgi:hypothetical protein
MNNKNNLPGFTAADSLLEATIAIGSVVDY